MYVVKTVTHTLILSIYISIVSLLKTFIRHQPILILYPVDTCEQTSPRAFTNLHMSSCMCELLA